MNKRKKIFCLLVVLLLVFGLFGCDEEDNEERTTKTYVMEAEYINLDDIVGAGISSEMSGVNMIYGEGTKEEKNKGWSEGYYIGFTYSEGISFDFEFTSDLKTRAAIIVRLGSEIGDITFDSSSLAVKLNGEAIEYEGILVQGSGMMDMVFQDFTITNNVELLEGKNVISIEILDNDLRNGQIAGPMIDCIKVRTNAKLEWEEKLDNPDLRGAI
ncbi:MAG: hypothetical protein GX149_02370 [Acholeplasmataceae bacterium]|nr:hypothetical protein [Acholeplasmataceae bacterium]